MMRLIHESLLSFNVKCRASDPAIWGTEKSDVQLRLRVGGMDQRKVRFKGWVAVENFVYGDAQGSFVIMQRDEVIISTLLMQSPLSLIKFQGSPLSWRQLWKALIEHDEVSPHVLRK